MTAARQISGAELEIDGAHLNRLITHWDAARHLTAAQIYLRDNPGL
ncbi:hypothetical protein [Pseudofrankia asymbiotica]|nr:hypothetical protein [Pseudofrankia asymbiotica]